MHVQEVSDGFSMEQIVPYFQPIIDVKTQRVWCYECLARLMYDADRTFLPSDFLYLVDKAQCNSELTQHIFHQAAEYFRFHQVNWGVNITADDICNPATIHFLKSFLHDYPNAHRVTLEVQASTVFDYIDEFRAFMLVCKALDIQLIIDNFGGLASNIPTILAFPVDGIKIDSKLITDLAANDKCKHKLTSALDTAAKNDVAIIAEHIEDEQTWRSVSNLPIQYGQGFYISHPAQNVTQ